MQQRKHRISKYHPFCWVIHEHSGSKWEKGNFYFLVVDANGLDSASYLSTQLAIELNGIYPLKVKHALQDEHYNTEILKIN